MNQFGTTIALEAKAVSEAGEFEGYAAWFNNVDHGGDIILPGAFAKSLKQIPVDRIKLCRSHDLNDPVGVLTYAAEDARGLKVKGIITQETTRGRETLALTRMGSLDSMSFGYQTKKYHYDKVKGARVIEELLCFEVSILAFGMNPKARVTAVKQDNPAYAARLVTAIHRAREALRA